jgi:hypothetical protein
VWPCLQHIVTLEGYSRKIEYQFDGYTVYLSSAMARGSCRFFPALSSSLLRFGLVWMEEAAGWQQKHMRAGLKNIPGSSISEWSTAEAEQSVRLPWPFPLRRTASMRPTRQYQWPRINEMRQRPRPSYVPCSGRSCNCKIPWNSKWCSSCQNFFMANI